MEECSANNTGVIYMKDHISIDYEKNLFIHNTSLWAECFFTQNIPTHLSFYISNIEGFDYMEQV